MSRNKETAIPEQLLRLMTSLQLPFRAVENEQFRKFIALLNSDFTLPSARTLRIRLFDRSAVIQSQLLDGFCDRSKLSLAIDCWSSPTRLSFLGVTAYFIDSQWQYRESLIGFEHIGGVHSGVQLAYILK